MTPRLNSLLSTSTRIVWRDENPVVVADPNWRVPVIVGAAVDEAHVAIGELEAYLSPATRSWIAARITALLGHWYIAEFPAAVMKAIIDDWVTALADFPAWAIAEGCQAYLSHHDRKPTVAAITLLCVEAVSSTRRELAALRRLVDPREQERSKQQAERDRPRPPPTAEDIAHVSAVLERAGFKQRAPETEA